VKVIVIGATGTIGRAVADALASSSHEVVAVSRTGDPRVDLADTATIADAIPYDDLRESIAPKLLGQICVAVHTPERLGWSPTPTSTRSRGTCKARSCVPARDPHVSISELLVRRHT
jgi:nucleoside-diphosphate-sugar epimerase